MIPVNSSKMDDEQREFDTLWTKCDMLNNLLCLYIIRDGEKAINSATPDTTGGQVLFHRFLYRLRLKWLQGKAICYKIKTMNRLRVL
jgi:hypothetical protein